MPLLTEYQKEEIKWAFNKVVVVDLIGNRGKCTRRFAKNVRKNVQSLSNPVEAVQYIAKIASQSVRIAAVSRTYHFHP